MSEANVKPIDCVEAARRLWAYLDGELEAPSAAEMERHLGECTRCFGVAETQRRFLGVVSDLPANAETTADLHARVEAALRTARASRQSDEK